jgi:hypothetical protein
MKDYVIDTLKKRKGNVYSFLKKNTKLMGILDSIYPNISDLKTKVRLYIHDLDDVPTCKKSGCENKVKYYSNGHGNSGFATCCSRKCLSSHMKENNLYVEYRVKAEQTMLERYGVENPSMIPEVRKKAKQTMLERYGVDSYSKTDEFKEKAKQTYIDRYGVSHPLNNPEIREKAKQTVLEKYGTEHYYQSDDFKQKSKTTNLEKHGVEYYSQTGEFKEKFKQTNLENRGIEHHKKAHYNSEYFNIFDNKEEFEKLLYEHGTFRLAELVNCDISTIHLNSKNYKIQLPSRNHSNQEEIIQKFLNDNNIPFVSNTRRILLSGKELDFYFPEHNLAIEVNGMYWHSELSGGKEKYYHYDKWKECDENGITLLSIYEDEFIINPQFWFNKILYMTGNTKLTKIHARKCEIKELDNVNDFLNQHHLQGSNSSKYKFGLFYNNELVSVMTFSNTRNNKTGTIDLSRFCNHTDYLVFGGASKLLSHFIKTNGHKYNEIISFSDNNYSNGNVYKTLGFSLVSDIPPDYKYISTKNYLSKYHKSGFRKLSIFKKFDIPDDMKDKSEWELMKYLGYDRIWDSGKKKWSLTI